ncbi:unnamed protein product [Clonostachys byssicola]|uniref:Major facilitator superfamily (MFS) profile domain-containing protein n=1 Tax=Clonostachys byssicola TaxID=160290 RepID=A0A9N9UDJ9_9HYPO|nr:unnamed protein product [Clonostachys byssicola]
MSTCATTVVAPAIELSEIKSKPAVSSAPLHRLSHDAAAGSQQSPDPTPPTEIPSLVVPTDRVFDAEPSPISQTSRFLIILLVVILNIVQFMSAITTVVGGLAFSAALGHEVKPGRANWMGASYSLTQGAFVFISGRLGEIYGHQRLVLVGSAVFTLFSLVNGFAKTYESFVAIRALTGIGGGIFMPNAVAIVTTMVPPGRTRNIALGFFAAAPPIGGVLGGVLVGVFIDLAPWVWLFVSTAIISAILTAWLAYLVPPEHPVDRSGTIDYIGVALGVSSLVLFNVVWNQAPAVGWYTPYEIALLIVSVLLFAGFLVWEDRFAKEPVMPLKLFRASTFTALVFVVLLSYMSVGVFVWYSVAWQQMLRHSSVLDCGIHFIPFGFGAVAAVGIAAWLIPRVAAQWIMAIGIVTILAANLLIATMPVQQIYWAQLFPAILLSSFCPDFVYVAAQLIASNSVGRRHQGVAGSLIGTLNLYGNSLGLGFAGTIETELADGESPGQIVFGFRAAAYFGVALAVASLILDLGFVRLPKDEREGWEEDEPLTGDQPTTVVHASATAVERQI